ncbi:MAG: hypothetical protein GY928_29775 [Colwellia sp.]|nr:hypothetical protein [Colwellia sp.]
MLKNHDGMLNTMIKLKMKKLHFTLVKNFTLISIYFKRKDIDFKFPCFEILFSESKNEKMHRTKQYDIEQDDKEKKVNAIEQDKEQKK